MTRTAATTFAVAVVTVLALLGIIHDLRDRLPDNQVAQFIAAGFTRDHVRLLRSSPFLR